MPAIEVTGLQRAFSEEVLAVAGIDLHVDEGEIYAFLGPNGAGKTTTVRMLTTLLRPTGGTARVAGHDVVEDPAAVRSAIGVALQEAALDPLMKGSELIRLQATLHGIPRAEGRRRADDLLRRVGLTSAQDRRVGHLFRRDEAAARPGVGARPRAARPLPRRADDRPRPGQPQGDLGGGRRSQPRGHDGLSDHPVPRGGRPARRSRRDHRGWADRRRGHAGVAEGRGRQAADGAGPGGGRGGRLHGRPGPVRQAAAGQGRQADGRGGRRRGGDRPRRPGARRGRDPGRVARRRRADPRRRLRREDRPAPRGRRAEEDAADEDARSRTPEPA